MIAIAVSLNSRDLRKHGSHRNKRFIGNTIANDVFILKQCTSQRFPAKWDYIIHSKTGSKACWVFQNCFVSVRQGLLLSQKYMILMQLSIHFKCNRQLFLETIISIKNSELKLRYLLLFRAFLPEYLSLSTFAFALRLSSNCLNFRVLWQVLEDVLLLVECKN